jgi:PTS system mannose-specific IIB component
LVAKTPGVFLDLVEAGLQIKELIVGNMGYATGRQRLTKNLYITPDEAAQLKKMDDLGISVVAQIVPDDNKKDILSMLSNIK